MFLAYHKYNKNVPEYVEHFGALSNLEQWRWLRGWYRTWPSYSIVWVCSIFPCLCYIYTIHTHIGGIGTWPSYSIAIIPDWVLAHVQPSSYSNTLQCTKYGNKKVCNIFILNWLYNIFELALSYWKRLVLQWKHIPWHMCYYCRFHVCTMCASCSLDCVLLILNVFTAIFGCTCMCHPHFLVSALYFFVHARYGEVHTGRVYGHI